jgi:NTP pyrophosphatase (non-canonical NTP hydrolase)
MNIEERKLLLLPVDSINGMAQEAFDNAEAHGFHEEGQSPIPEMLMLIVSEAAEALEEDRKSGFLIDPIRYREDGKPEGFGPELADIVIRTGHLAAAQGIDLADMVRQVQTFNRTRPHKHGKKY